MKLLFTLLFIFCGTFSAYLVNFILPIISGEILFYLIGGIYGLATVWFLPALASANITPARNLFLRTIWVTGTTLIFFLAVQVFILFLSLPDLIENRSSITTTDAIESLFLLVSQINTTSIVLAGITGSLIVMLTYAFIAHYAYRQIRWKLLILLPVIGGLVPLVLSLSYNMPYSPSLHYIWQFAISAWLVIVITDTKKVQ